jgi:hypothetical protein
VRQECVRPESIAEEPYDFSPLLEKGIPLDRSGPQRLSREVAPHKKLDVLGRYVRQPELEEGLLGLEVTDLQHTRDALREPSVFRGEGALFLGEREIFRALEFVEVGQAVQDYGAPLRRQW